MDASQARILWTRACEQARVHKTYAMVRVIKLS
ncbi:hypothetical protein SAMN05216504_0716 [Pseudomonas sp. A214]|jgi:hypothetical protein|nr:hypothetical protein SAMN05216504_0716 [Pseudomonas sp. A214]